MEASGTITLRGDLIRCESAYGTWELPIDRVRVIGEATTDHGPFVDDYWLCFATSPKEWYEASFYAAGRDEFLKALSARFVVPIELRLVASTKYASRVLWPAILVDKPMFVYTGKWPSNRLLRVVVKLLGGPLRNVQAFSQDVERYLREVTRWQDK
jgi:hypothetical protein